jgi:hypothetical protein
MQTPYIFPSRVVERTNPTISPPTDELRPREQNHRDQRDEEHIKGQGRSWAFPRGRFTLQLPLPAHLASRLDSRLESPSGYPAVTFASPRHASPHLTLPRDSRLTTHESVGLPCSDPRLAPVAGSLQSIVVPCGTHRVPCSLCGDLPQRRQSPAGTPVVSLSCPSGGLRGSSEVFSGLHGGPGRSAGSTYPAVSSAKMCEMV